MSCDLFRPDWLETAEAAITSRRSYPTDIQMMRVDETEKHANRGVLFEIYREIWLLRQFLNFCRTLLDIK